MKVRLKSMGFQSKSCKKSIKNEQNQPLPVWGGPLECRYTVLKCNNNRTIVCSVQAYFEQLGQKLSQFPRQN